MRSSRILLNRPSYYYIAFELSPEVRRLTRAEMEGFAEVLIGVCRFHDAPLVAYSVSPVGAHAIVLDRKPSPISLQKALEMEVALAPESAAAQWKSILDRGGKLSPSFQKSADLFLKRRGTGLEALARSAKSRFVSHTGRDASEKLWCDRFRSHPVQDNPQVLARLITFIHTHDARRAELSSLSYPSSEAATESGDKEVRAAMVEALKSRNWSSARSILKATKGIDITSELRRNRKGGVCPDFGVIPQNRISSALRRAAERKPDPGEFRVRFEKMLAQWSAHVRKYGNASKSMSADLRKWAGTIRAKKQRGKLAREWEAKLSSLGFPWRIYKQKRK